MKTVLFSTRMIAALLIFFIGGAALLSGCSLINSMIPPKIKLEKPRLTLLDVHLLKKTKSAPMAPRFRVRLKVENPNNIEVPIGGIDFRLELQGMTLANGVGAEFFTIPAKGDTEFDVDVSTEVMKAMKQVSALLKSGEAKVEYRIVGRIHVEIPYVGAVPFDKKGLLQLPLKWGD